MSLAKEKLSPDRAEFTKSLSAAEVNSLARDPDLRVLQTSSPVNAATWDLLNDRLFSRRPDVELRVYGFYSSTCDLSFLPGMQNVRRFLVDCLREVRGIEHLAALKNLESLSVGIYGLESFDFLERLPTKTLRELSLSGTKSKKPSLAPLARFDQLRRLSLFGQQKSLDVISGLTMLEDLTLGSISVDGLEFLRSLRRLWSLAIRLGGSNNLAALEGMPGIKYLELCHVRGLQDISVVSKLRGLQFLFLQSLPKISIIPELSRLRALRRVYLESMTGLKDLRPFAAAPALEDFIHVCARGMEPDQYRDLLKKQSLRRILVGFGSQKKNSVMLGLAAQAGIDPFEGTEFEFA